MQDPTGPVNYPDRQLWCTSARLGIIFWNTLSRVIRECESPLAFWVTLIGGFGIPADGSGVVLWNAGSKRISGPKIDLRRRIAMLRGLLPPLHGLRLILRHSFTEVIRLGKGQLCFYVSVLSLALEFGDALRVPDGQYREQTENGAQQDMPPSSVCRGPCFHARSLLLNL